MSPRKRATGIRPADASDEDRPVAPHEGVSEDDLSEDVEGVLAQLGEAASQVIVARMKDNKPGEWAHITKMPASEFNVESIKEQFGGGEYKITIIDRTQGALNPVYLSIDPRFVGKFWGSASPALATLPAPASSSEDAFKNRLLEVLLVRALTPAPAPPPPPDNTEVIFRVAELFSRNNNGGGNVAEQVASLMSTATQLATAMNPPDGLAGVASAFLPVVERLTSNAHPATPAPRRLPPVAPPTSPVATATPSLTVTAAPAAAPVNNPPSIEGTPARVAGSIIPRWLAPFKMLSPMLVSFADQGSDPTLYADVAIERFQIDEALFASAVEAMNAGHLLSDLFALAPALQETDERKEFATQLVAGIEKGLRELIESDNEPETMDAADNG